MRLSLSYIPDFFILSHFFKMAKGLLIFNQNHHLQFHNRENIIQMTFCKGLASRCIRQSSWDVVWYQYIGHFYDFQGVPCLLG